jgi:hypothetical protein
LWAKQFEGDVTEYGLTLDVDSLGHVYVGGYFYEGMIDMNPGVDNLIFNSAGDGDFFIVKLSADGDFIWAKQFGSTGSDQITAIQLDAYANIYATGHFQYTVDFNPGAGDSLLTGAGPYSSGMFVLKLDSAANFIWVDLMVSTNWVAGYSLALVDSLIYIAGDLGGSSDLDPGTGVFTLNGTGTENTFLMKLDTSGVFYNAISFGTTSGGIDNHSIAIDVSQNIYVSGLVSGATNFDAINGTAPYTDTDGAGDLYVAKYDSDFNFMWVFATGSISTCRALAIETDAAGFNYATGYFIGTVDFDSGPGITELNSDTSGAIFLLKMDSDGNFVNVDQIGTGGFEEGRALAIDSYGEIAMTGKFYGSTDMGVKAPITTVDGYSDAFVHKRSKAYLKIDESDPTFDLTISPNPSSGIFNLTLAGSSEISVSTILGEVILNTVFSPGDHQLDLQEFPKGVYVITIRQDQLEKTYKVIKL